jgi:hypothetical protein
MYEYGLYAVIAALAVISAVTLAFNVRAGNKLAEVRRKSSEYQAQSVQAKLALIAAAEEEMDARVAKATLAALKKAYTVEKHTGLTIGEVFGTIVGAGSEPMDAREVIAAGFAHKLSEGAELGESSYSNFGGASGLGEILSRALREGNGGSPATWTDEGVHFTKADGLTTATFDWGPGEPIPANLPPQVQDLLRNLQAEHDANEGNGGIKSPNFDTNEGSGGTRHHFDAPDAEDLQAQKVSQSAEPLADPVEPLVPRRRNKTGS